MSKDALIYRVSIIDDALKGFSDAFWAISEMNHNKSLRYAAIAIREVSDYAALTLKALEEKEKTDE